MAVGFPTKANWAAGDVLTASAQDDLAGTVNLLSNASAASGSQLVSNVAGTSFVWQGSIAGGKNFVINGGMDIWQRGTTSTATGYQTADRWAPQSATTTQSQDTSVVPVGARYSLRLTTSAVSVQPYVLYAIETADAQRLAGQTVTLSMECASSASQVINMTLAYSTSSDPGIGSGTYVAITASSGGTVSTNATTTTRGSGVYVIPSTAKSLRILIQPAAVIAASGGWYNFGNVQLELGSVATAFSRAGGTLQGELNACMRYYWRNSASASYSPLTGVGVFDTTTDFRCTVPFPVTMRTNPAYSSSAASSMAASGTGLLAASATGLKDSSTPNNANIYFTVSGATAGQAAVLYSNNNSSAYLEFSAEL